MLIILLTLGYSPDFLAADAVPDALPDAIPDAVPDAVLCNV